MNIYPLINTIYEKYPEIDEDFVTIKLAEFLADIMKVEKYSKVRKKIFLDDEQIKISEKFLWIAEQYRKGDLSLDELIHHRCEAWRMLYKSKGRFQYFINLTLLTLFDYQKEKDLTEGGDEDGLFISFFNLNNIDSSLAEEFYKNLTK